MDWWIERYHNKNNETATKYTIYPLAVFCTQWTSSHGRVNSSELHLSTMWWDSSNNQQNSQTCQLGWTSMTVDRWIDNFSPFHKRAVNFNVEKNLNNFRCNLIFCWFNCDKLFSSLSIHWSKYALGDCSMDERDRLRYTNENEHNSINWIFKTMIRVIIEIF